MSTLRTLFAMFAIFLGLSVLSGCATTPAEYRLVQSETLTLIEPDPQYLADCQTEPALRPELYMAMGMDEREDALTRLVIAQYANLKNCTDDKRRLRAAVEKQRKIVDDHNAAEKLRAAAALKGK